MIRLRNLSIGRKFLLIALLTLGLCAPPTALLLSAKVADLRAARMESEGVAPLGALLEVIRLTQVHRGLSTNWLGGQAALADARAQRAGELDQAMARLKQAAATYPNGPVAERLGRIQQDWQAVREAIASRAIDGPTGFQRHSALVGLQLRLLSDLADRSGLVLDPEAGTYQLVAAITGPLPAITEVLGQARALGALHLKRGTASAEDKARLQQLAERAGQLAGDIDQILDHAGAHDAALLARLDATHQAARSAVAAGLAEIDGKLLKPASLDAPPAAYFDAMTAHIDAQFKLVQASFDTLSQRLDQRVAETRRLLLAVTALVLVLGAAAAGVMRAVTLATRRTVANAQAAAEALARGDLGHRVLVDGDDELARMARTLGGAMAHLAEMVREIKAGGESVSTASAQIAAGNADLSARTEQAAASLQQAASSMEQLQATVRQNAESAHRAAQLAGHSSTVAADGGALVGRVVDTMAEISQRSDRITDIVGVIDGIAFQTNILALNAAVEAARAGEQGRGFAVVAAEVRSLAQRSAQAAREVKSLIAGSVSTVETGSALVGEAQQTMHQIVEQAGQVNALVAAIGSASAEQTDGIAQVNVAVRLLDQATQQNAALVEESAAAAESLNQQARRLVDAVARFSLTAA